MSLLEYVQFMFHINDTYYTMKNVQQDHEHQQGQRDQQDQRDPKGKKDMNI